MKVVIVLVCACAMAARFAEAFVPALGSRAALAGTAYRHSSTSPAAAPRPQTFAQTSLGGMGTSRYVSGRSATSVTTMGLFGLGAPEIAVCLVVAAVILGPDKLAGVAKDVGKMAGELKDVPKEFQAGIAEGEAKAAKQIGPGSGPIMDAQESDVKIEEKENA